MSQKNPPKPFKYDLKKRTKRTAGWFGDKREMEAPDVDAPTFTLGTLPTAWDEDIPEPEGYDQQVREVKLARRKKQLEALKKARLNPKPISTATIDPKHALELYNQYVHPDNKLVKRVIGAGLPSAAERKRRKEAKKKREDQLFAEWDKPEDREAAIKLGRKMFAAATGRARPKLTPDQRVQRQAKQNLHIVYPNAIYTTDKNVRGYLKSMRGKKYENPTNQNWEGKNYKTLPEEDLTNAENTFAEFTGMLGYMPTYDKKLASLKTAKRAYPADEYDVRAYDMDNDPLTPENVIIRRKKDKRLVAANGYRLTAPNERQQMRRLQQMEYYRRFPTAEDRKGVKFTDFLSVAFNKTQKNKGYNQITKYINYIFVQFLGVQPKKQPVLLRLYTSGNWTDLGVYAEMSMIGWNTMVSRMAKLYLDMFVWKYIGFSTKYETLESKILNEYQEHLEGTPDFTQYIVPDLEVYNWIMQSNLMQPDLERALLNIAGIQDKIKELMDAQVAKLTADDEAKQAEVNSMNFLADLVIKLFMKSNQSTLIALIDKDGRDSSTGTSAAAATEGVKDATTAFFSKYMFLPVPTNDPEYTNYIENRDKQGSSIKYVSIVPGKTAYTESIKYWGEEYVSIMKVEDVATAEQMMEYGEKGYSDDDRSDDTEYIEEEVEEEVEETEEEEEAEKPSSSSSSSSSAPPMQKEEEEEESEPEPPKPKAKPKKAHASTRIISRMRKNKKADEEEKEEPEEE